MATTYLRKAFSTTGTSRQKFSLSMWIKRGSGLGVEQMLCECYSGSSAKDEIWLQSNDTLNFVKTDGGGLATTTAPVYRDLGAWYHFLIAADTTQGSNADRIKIYKNGVQQTLGQQDTIVQNSNFQFGASGTNLTFGMRNATDWYFDGSMANVEMVDGQQLDPTYFGSTDSTTGIWTPSGATAISNYGTNGFKLKMDTTSPGADTSGKGNTFTASGSPTLLQGNPQNNWCTLNPNDVLRTNGGIQVPTFSNGNTTMASSSNVSRQTFGTIGVETGKFYWETKITVANSTGHRVGVFFGNNKYDGSNSYYNGANAFYIHQNGQIYYNGSSTTYMASYGINDIITIALDRTNGQIYLSKNGGASDSTWADGNGNNNQTFANAVSISTKLSVTMPSDITQPFFDIYGTGNTMSVNFGEGFFGTVAAGTNADGNGQGLFAYAVPSGYYALNTKNLEAYG